MNPSKPEKNRFSFLFLHSIIRRFPINMSAPRAAKKAKLNAAASTSASKSGEVTGTRKKMGLFAPFRSLGHISTSVPFAVQSKSSKFLETPAIVILTSLGNNWAMWDGANLKLIFVGEDVSPLCFVGEKVSLLTRWVEIGRTGYVSTYYITGVLAGFCVCCCS